MKNKSRIITASVTVLAAAATAHLMQRGSDSGANLSAMGPAQAAVITPAAAPPAARIQNTVTVITPKPAPVPQEIVAATPNPHPDAIAVTFAAATVDDVPTTDALTFPNMPRPPADAIMPKPLPALGPELRARMASISPVVEQPAAPAAPEVKRSEFGLTCGALLTATPKDAAMVGLTLTDPCRSSESFTVQHGDLIFKATLDNLGTYMADIPAIYSTASFLVTFSDGLQAEAEIDIPMTDDLERVALISAGQTGLQIHALEFGADYEEPGHVWSGNPRNPASAARAGGGFVTTLGDASLPDAMLAEVYTFPANTRQQEGVVRLSIETEVTSYNCAKDISGQTLQKGANGAMRPVTLTLAMPDCDAIGEFLVLKNLLRDLKIASN